MTYYLILPPHSGSPQPYITWERGGQPTRPATHTSSAQVALCDRNSVEKVDSKFILHLYQKLQFIKCLSIETIARDSPSDAIDNKGTLVSITDDLQNVTKCDVSRAFEALTLPVGTDSHLPKHNWVSRNAKQDTKI